MTNGEKTSAKPQASPAASSVSRLRFNEKKGSLQIRNPLIRTFSTPASGEFVFTTLQPGPYSLKVEAQGFKSLEKTDLQLTASERLSAGDLALQIGTVNEVIKVTAEATPVQTASSERSGLSDSTATRVPEFSFFDAGCHGAITPSRRITSASCKNSCGSKPACK